MTQTIALTLEQAELHHEECGRIAYAIEEKFEDAKKAAFINGTSLDSSLLNDLKAQYHNALVALMKSVIVVMEIRFGADSSDVRYWESKLKDIEAGNLYSMVYAGFKFNERTDYAPLVLTYYYFNTADKKPARRKKAA